jgi:hypothetical protein
MRAYLRLDPNLRKQKRDYPDGAFRAFVETLCAAETQPQRGRFESRAVLRALLGPRARWITYLWEHGDLAWEDDGVLVVTGWDDWQEGDVTVPERMARLRAKKAGKVTPTDTVPVTAPVTPYVTPARLAVAVSGKRIAKAQAEADDRARPSTEPVDAVLDRVVGDLKNGHAEPEEVDAFIFGIRLLGYVPNNDDFRTELIALEEQYGVMETVQAEQDVYRIAVDNGHRLKPFDLVKNTRALLVTGKHREERELSAQEKQEQAERAKARDAAMLADINRQHEEMSRRPPKKDDAA